MFSTSRHGSDWIPLEKEKKIALDLNHNSASIRRSKFDVSLLNNDNTDKVKSTSKKEY